METNGEFNYIERRREREDQMEAIRFSQFKWMTYVFRFLFILFITSSFIEILRLSADDHAEFQYAYHNTPKHCLGGIGGIGGETNNQSWSWSSITTTISYPFKSLYQVVFEPPVASDCAVFFRKTNPMLLYLPRIPQAISNVISNFFLTPFVMFLDKFGDALRDFLDKFNVAERLFGIIILLAGMILSCICFICVMWLLFRQQPTPQVQMCPPSMNQLTYQEKESVTSERERDNEPNPVRRSTRLLQKL
jgi:hypothetical protein